MGVPYSVFIKRSASESNNEEPDDDYVDTTAEPVR